MKIDLKTPNAAAWAARLAMMLCLLFLIIGPVNGSELDLTSSSA